MNYKISVPVEVDYISVNHQTGLTDLQMVVTDPTGSSGSPVTLTEDTPSIYSGTFTPDLVGFWIVTVSSVTAPLNNNVTTYFVLSEYGTQGITVDTSALADKASMESGEDNIIAFLDSSGNLVDSHLTVSTDTSMVDDSNDEIPTQAAIVAYVTGKGYLTSAVTSFNTRTGGVTLESSDVTTALTYTPSKQATSPTNGDIASVDSDGNVIDSGKVFSTDGTFADNSDSEIPTQKATLTYLNTFLAANQALVYKGSIDLSGNPNYPAATNGYVYAVSVAGKIGGASGTSLTQGDLIICLITNAGGDQSTVGSDFDTIQLALNGIVVGPTSSTSNDFAMFNGTSGAVIQDSGLSLSTDGTMAGDSDLLIPSQKSVVTYVASEVANYLPLSGGTLSGNLTISTHNIITDTSTGTKIGTATNQKLGFFNASPVVQQTGAILTALSNLGLVATPSISQADITSLVSSGKTVTFQNSITFAGTDSTTMTFPSSSDTVVTLAATQTLTNKRNTLRVGSTITNSAPSIDTDTYDVYELTAQSGAINFSTNLTGTPNAKDLLEIEITDNGTPVTITWGAKFASTTVTLPTTTVASTPLKILVQWSVSASIWQCVGVA